MCNILYKHVMEAIDWGGLWVLGSSIGGALGPGEAIPVSDGHNQPTGKQLIKWTWRLLSNSPYMLQSINVVF